MSATAAPQTSPSGGGARPRAPLGPAALAAVAVVSLCLVAVAALCLGASTLSPATAWRALTAFDGSRAAVAVAEVRLPRLVTAAVVGAALATAGALMQVISRNPLAEPGLLGVSWGAALAAVVGQDLVGIDTQAALVPVAVAGGGAAGLAVIVLAGLGRGTLGPERVVLAGVAVSSLLAAIVQGLLVVDRQSLEAARRWLAGSLTGAGWDGLLAALPYLGLGAALSVALVRPLGILALGDAAASGLGQRPARIRALAAVAVVLLSGAAAAVAGPIALVGLAIPHVSRAVAGSRLSRTLAFGSALGAVLVIASDTVARLVVAPEELPVGVLTAVLGTPVLLRVVRRMRH